MVINWFDAIQQTYTRGRKGLLVARYHHGVMYYDATSMEQLLASALNLLQWRVKEERWGNEEDEREPEEPAMSRQEINNLADEHLREVGLEMWQGYDEDMKAFKKQHNHNMFIRTALAEQNGRQALYALLNYGGGDDKTDLEWFEE